jgi:peptide/nickel transport system permease protein
MATTTSVTLRPARSARQLALAGLLKRISGNFVVRRVFKAFFTIFFVITLTFFLIRLLPGNPVEVYINTQMGQYGIPYQDAAAQAAALFSIDPNEPMYHQ